MKKRILLIGFAVTAVALLLFSILSTSIYYHHSLSQAEGMLKAYLSAFDEEKTLQELDVDYAHALADELSLARVRVSFLDGEGHLIADSHGDESAPRGDRPEVKEALLSGEGFDTRSSSTRGESFVYYCKNFAERGYMVRLALPTSSMWSIYVRGLPAVALFLVVDALVCLLITYLATGFMLRPVTRLAREAAQKRHVDTDSPELKPIAELMNRMNDDVAAHIREVDEEKEVVEKMQQSKNEFIANITHEMNTPLTSIKGFAELLSAGSLEGAGAQRAAGIILKQSERLTSLVSCIIHYNEIDSEELPAYEVNASNIARDLLEGLAPEFDAHELVLLSKIEDDVVLMSRHERVTEIFGNLIRNAIRYNKAGGSVSVLLTRQEFVVSDTGIGISEENLKRIFDRFFTVDKSHSGKNGGFGLGLSVVKKLCKKAGWQLSVKSELGKGTTFRILFVDNAE